MQKMFAILFLGKTCKSYTKRYKNNSPNALFHCDRCSQKMHKHGHYLRTVVTKQQLIVIPIYRWCCPKCHRTLSLLPDFLVPWARFWTPVREAACLQRIQGKSFKRIATDLVSTQLEISRTTVKRWWRRHLLQSAKAAMWLLAQRVQTGFGEDLLRYLFQGVASTELDTALGCRQLQQLYRSQFDLSPLPLRGYWCWTNTLLPQNSIL